MDKGWRSNNNEITILGRGKSLEKLKGFEVNSNSVIAVNEFWKTRGNPSDYYKEPIIAAFLNGKDITLLTTPRKGCGHALSKDLESTHNVINKFNTVWSGGSGTDRDQPPVPSWSVMPKECLEVYKYTHLSGNLKSSDLKGKGAVRGSLAYAILLAVKYYDAGVINIFGLDFYEADYFVPQHHNYEKEKTQSESIKKDFSSLFNYFQHVQFNVHTLANYNPNLNNVNVK